MKRKNIILIIGMVCTVIFLTACGKAEVSSVKPLAETKSKNIIEATGIVKASSVENIVIDMPMGAKVLKVDVKEGQKVKKGDKLVELDITEYNALISQKSNVIESDKYLRKDMQTDNQKKAQDLKIAAEQTELDSLKAKLTKAYFSEGSIVSDLENAVVTDIGYKTGDIVSAKLKDLSLEDLNSLIVQANVDEELIKDVKEGKIVTIIPKSDPTTKLTGKVTRIFNTAITQNGGTSVAVEISIDNNNGKLLPNYNVDVEINKN